jgi:hypothetical protein
MAPGGRVRSEILVRVGLVTMLAGLAIVSLAQLGAPARALPLYDGVIVQESYRWLHPPACQSGGPSSAATEEVVPQGASPGFVVATFEQPPQAQLLVAPNSLPLPSGTTSIKVSITPIDGPTAPVGKEIAGNVYRFALTTQSGAPITAPTSAAVTVVLRGPSGIPAAIVGQYVGGFWQELPTAAAGLPHTYQAVITQAGTFALFVPAGTTFPCPGVAGTALDSATIIRIVVFAIVFIPIPILSIFWVRARRRRR